MALAGASDAGDYPWRRVVNRKGNVSGGAPCGHPDMTRQLLEEEGVPFIGEHTVDLAACLWEPLVTNHPDGP
jgi:alkylated DNA nucleotide flippase Atl1